MSWPGSIAEGAKVLVAWTLGGLVTAFLTAGASHGWSVVIFLVVVVVGSVAGLIHAVITVRRCRKLLDPVEQNGR